MVAINTITNVPTDIAVPLFCFFSSFTNACRKIINKNRNMSNTYTQIHIQTVFAVQYREALISPEWNERLYQYMASIINDQGHKTLAIGGVANHVHLLFGFRPTQSLSSLMMRVKRETSEWINKERLTNFRFQWQEGYGRMYCGC